MSHLDAKTVAASAAPASLRPLAPGEVADLWQSLTAMMGDSPDQLMLILPESDAHEGRGLFKATAWVEHWAEHCRAVAYAALACARDEGTAHVELSARNVFGGVTYWDVCLSRLAGGDTLLSVARDITERMAQEAQLRRVAYQDGLTGLLNRAALRERLAQEIVTASRAGGSVALLLLDLDNFKLINDTLGHDAGDAVLVEAATRLLAAAPKGSAVGRLGGDEFAVIVPSLATRPDFAPFAEALLVSMKRPVFFNGRQMDTRASIGVALYPQHGSEPSELLKNADIALYAAKSFGRGGFTGYVLSMGTALRKRAERVASVRDAIAQGRLEVLYQPKVDLLSHAVIGFEAISQLRDSAGSVLPAHAIKPALEDVDLAREIGQATFDRVASDMRRWQAAGISVGRVALNAAAAEFRKDNFATRLLQKVRDAGLSPESFEIEVAETVLTGRGSDYVATALADLAAAGVHVALDEFGTGASSLAQLRNMQFHAIKIDRTFVTALEDHSQDRAIVRAIVGLADGLGLGITAVGVETGGQVEALCALGCTVGQGDFIGPAITSTAVEGRTLQLRGAA